MRGYTSHLRLIITVLGLILTSAAQAKDYIIELVVFENTGPDTSAGEVFLRASDLPALSSAATGERVHASGWHLDTAVQLLRANADYRLLHRQRWQQESAGKKQSRPVRITDASSSLEGTAHFYQARFLQLDLALNYFPDGITSQSAGNTWPTSIYDSESGFTISQKIRLRPKQVHYFDHPKFGALVALIPAKK